MPTVRSRSWWPSVSVRSGPTASRLRLPGQQCTDAGATLTHPPPTPRTVTFPVTPSTTSVTPSGTPLRPHRTVPVPVDELAALAGAAVPLGWSGSSEWPSAVVTGVALRASQVQPGDLFAALPSVRPGRPHGADFAA